MGLFDSVMVPCPNCGKPMEFQTKADEDPYMREFDLVSASAEMLRDIRNDPRYHETCGQWVALVDPKFPPGAEQTKPELRVVKVRAPDNPVTHEQGFKWWPDNQPFTLADIEP